jgi:prolyl-tRNA synthetase
MEIGPRDLAANQCRLVRRDNGVKADSSREGIVGTISELLVTIQASMFAKAKEDRDAHIIIVRTWAEFVPALEKRCLVLTPFCDESEWEEKVKKMSRDEALRGSVEAATTATSVAAKTLCKPFKDQSGFTCPELEEGTMCFVSGLPAKAWTLWGRSY